MEFQGGGLVGPAGQVCGISFQGILQGLEESGGTFGAEGICGARGHRRKFGSAGRDWRRIEGGQRGDGGLSY